MSCFSGARQPFAKDKCVRFNWDFRECFSINPLQPRPPYFISAIVASSIMFGLGHLSFAFALIPDASVLLVLYVIVGNSFLV